MVGVVQPERFGGTRRVEFMNPSGQSIDRRSPLGDKVFAAINQQLDLTRHLIVASDRQVRLP